MAAASEEGAAPSALQKLGFVREPSFEVLKSGKSFESGTPGVIFTETFKHQNIQSRLDGLFYRPMSLVLFGAASSHPQIHFCGLCMCQMQGRTAIGRTAR
eukprot:EG_transcript_64995